MKELIGNDILCLPRSSLVSEFILYSILSKIIVNETYNSAQGSSQQQQLSTESLNGLNLCSVIKYRLEQLKQVYLRIVSIGSDLFDLCSTFHQRPNQEDQKYKFAFYAAKRFQ